ncbi:hypothetical protein ['Santalum album' aster yellows phytoplasma]|uniref:Uncharacterized protein n=1 Tax='Santalum album' aster yellows phytoplasma TaxID=2831467 RepID=A0ABS5LLP1_9MOLU|nr:hypothetical protein ['Santalum album' aster yellows phytoplasma]MBS2994125.1 hypothetical protein ['Santalum album' aster yellows phytoplasma]
MDIQQTIINIVESKLFISFISFIFGIFIYWFYFYIKELKSKYNFSDELHCVVNKYIKNGQITVREFGALIRIISQMGNYLGIYKDHVNRMIKEFGEHGGLNFSEGLFDEIKKDDDNEKKENNNLDEILKENLKLKNQLNNTKKPLIVESIDDTENDL